jgi:hypothetical protein
VTFRVLVTGSRTWTDDDAVYHALNQAVVASAGQLVVVVHGACRTGVDLFAA